MKAAPSPSNPPLRIHSKKLHALGDALDNPDNFVEFGTGGTGMAGDDGRELRDDALDVVRAISERPGDSYFEVDKDDADVEYAHELLRLFES